MSFDDNPDERKHTIPQSMPSIGSIEKFGHLNSLLTSLYNEYQTTIIKGLTLKHYYNTKTIDTMMKRSNNKYTEKVKHYNAYLNLSSEVNQLERLISMNNTRTTSSNNNNKKKKSSSSLHFFESPKKQNAVHNNNNNTSTLERNIKQLSFLLYIKKHRNRNMIESKRNELNKIKQSIHEYEDRINNMRIKIENQISNQYEQLIDAEQRVAVASIEEAKALLNRKVHLVSNKMARDFDHQMEKNVRDSEYEMKQTIEATADTLEQNLRLQRELSHTIERNKTLQLMLNADINLTDEEDRTNFIVLNKYGGIVDGNSMDHDDDDALNVEYITRQQQQQGTNCGRVDKQLLRKLWNTHRVKSKHILNFLWDVTGKSFSKRALFIADQEVNRLEKRYAGPDGMWIQNVLRSENEVKDFKEHRDSFMRKKYIKLKHREAIEHRKEVDSWQNGLRS